MSLEETWLCRNSHCNRESVYLRGMFSVTAGWAHGEEKWEARFCDWIQHCWLLTHPEDHWTVIILLPPHIGQVHFSYCFPYALGESNEFWFLGQFQHWVEPALSKHLNPGLLQPLLFQSLLHTHNTVLLSHLSADLEHALLFPSWAFLEQSLSVCATDSGWWYD